MAKYLVTGGAGFIGSNVTTRLLAEGHTVTVLDDFSSGSPKNLAGLTDQVVVIEGDIRDTATCASATAGQDIVLHFAAQRAVQHSVDDPRRATDVNVTGTLNLLIAARDTGVKRLVFSSSSSVYGNNDQSQQVETMPPRPASPYALTKFVGEEYCRLFSELYGLHTVALRYFNVFGPGQTSQSQYAAVIPIFVDQMLKGEAPEIHWDGNQSRDFTYVENVITANLAASTAEVEPGQVFNIGNGRTTSVNQLYDALQKLLNVRIPPRRTPKRPGDIALTRADISKAAAQLGWRPTIDFETGLGRAIDWYTAQARAVAPTS